MVGWLSPNAPAVEHEAAASLRIENTLVTTGSMEVSVAKKDSIFFLKP